MADEFRIAYAAFLRSWIGEEFFARGHSEEDFEDMVNQLVVPGRLYLANVSLLPR